MLGSSLTQALFASANSIAIVPKLWAEWNYNSFVQPYVVTSSSASQLTTAYNTPANWTADSNGAVYAGNLGDNVSSKIIPSAPIVFSIRKKIDDKGSDQGKITSYFTGPGKVLGNTDPGKFYKFVFYVKVYEIGENYDYPLKVNFVSASSNIAGSTSVTYRIAGVSSNNQHVQNPLASTSKTLTTSNGASVTLKFKSPSALSQISSFKIYKTIGTNNTTHYLTTVKGVNYGTASYVDIAPTAYADSYTPSTYTNDIFICPILSATNFAGNEINLDSYIRSTDFQTGELSTLEGSIQASSDVWRRVEVWFGTSSDSSLNINVATLSFTAMAEYEYAKFLVSDIELYPVTEHDFYLNSYYPTESVFKPFRPGEALLHPLLPTADQWIKTNTFTASYRKPATLAVKTPQTIFAKEFITPELAMIPSIYDKFKYYISSSNEKSIQARYSQYLSINKLVLKYTNKIAKMTSGSVIFYSGSANASTRIALSASDFNTNGITVLYYSSAGWSTSSWTSPPTLSSSGTFQNVVTDIQGITFTAPDTNTYVAPKGTTTGDKNRMHLVEMSPRLELDLSPLLQDYNIRTDFTSPNTNGFPISYINSNSGQVTLSNIPVYQNENIGATIFENQSSQSSFYNLLRQGVKFYGFLESPSFQPDLTEKIPQYVMYVDNWTISDINDVSVEMFDITKTHNGLESPHFACERSSLFDIITTLLNIIGFSDYDYDDLWQICNSSTNTPSFWYDESKSVMDNLQDLLVSHQISASIDEYGIMRFKSLKNILDQLSSLEYVPDFAITDVTRNNIGSSSITYIPNIIPDSFTESVGDKVGKIQIKYRIPKNYNSVNNDEKNDPLGIKPLSLNSESSTKVWEEQEDASLVNFDLAESFNKKDNYISFSVQKNFSDPRKSITEFSGDLMIGSEIVGYSGMEYVFSPIGVPNIYISRIVEDESDISRAIEEIKDIYTSSGLPLSEVSYIPTGRLVGAQRGKYGTKIADHLIATPTSLAYFSKLLYSINNTSATNTTKNVSVGTKGLILSANKANEYVMLSPDTSNASKYNLFSLDFTVPMESDKVKAKTVKVNYKKVNGKLVKDKNGKIIKDRKISAYTDYHNLSAGVFFNLNGTTVSGTSYANSTHFVEMSSAQSRFGKREVSYYLNFYRIAKKKKQQIISQMKIDNVFDGQPHRLSIYLNDQDLAISIDGERITNTRKVKITQPFYNVKDSKFGAYVKANENNQSVTMIVNELYADKVESDSTGSIPPPSEYPIENKYYFSSKDALDKIVGGFAQKQSSYLFQSIPKAYGLKFYNVKHGLSPIRPGTATILPVQYGSKAVKSKTNDQANILGPIVERDISYSSLYSTPFMSRFIIVNNSNQRVIISSPADKKTNSPIRILANYQLLSEERIVERVFDPNYTLSIDLSTDWVASKAEAEKILSLLAKSTNTFYSDISVSVFGNPLIQVGDFVEVTYGLKRIGYNPVNPSFDNTLNCMVISVDQGFNGSLVDTKLTLKPLIIS